MQPREAFDKEKIKELANSIKEADLLQPIVVRKINGNFQIIAGERRWRAFSFLKRKTIPSIVWIVKDDWDALEKSAIENIQREDLTSTERENVIYELWKSKRYETKRELNKKLGYTDPDTVSHIVVAKEDREKLEKAGSEPVSVSTRTIRQTAGLEPEQRLEVIKAVEKGDIGADRVLEEVRLIKAEKEIKEKYEIEIPKELKKASFVVDFSTKCMDTTNWFAELNKVPKEAWEKTVTPAQLTKMIKSATILREEIDRWLEIMEVIE